MNILAFLREPVAQASHGRSEGIAIFAFVFGLLFLAASWVARRKAERITPNGSLPSEGTEQRDFLQQCHVTFLFLGLTLCIVTIVASAFASVRQ